ncbi:hypothetical protein, partial [Komagataeibacter rhaeticus]|uniref:hypothetical protein n=1 Tax=Komagataeibacter rhaeticus TaxID=215221 RepID=UPI00249084BC
MWRVNARPRTGGVRGNGGPRHLTMPQGHAVRDACRPGFFQAGSRWRLARPWPPSACGHRPWDRHAARPLRRMGVVMPVMVMSAMVMSAMVM